MIGIHGVKLTADITMESALENGSLSMVAPVLLQQELSFKWHVKMDGSLKEMIMNLIGMELLAAKRIWLLSNRDGLKVKK